MANLKIVTLSDSAFRLWIRGLCYCQTALTDGLIPAAALRDLGAKAKDIRELQTPTMNGHAPLWVKHQQGVQVHDYLHWNDSREQVVTKQRVAKYRRAFLTDHTMRARVKARDGDTCHFCSRHVSWTDRKGPAGATYDSVVTMDGSAPGFPFVVACRECAVLNRDRKT